jgi:CubicO group peptidase (beta-lactamase class C family)
MRKRIMSRLPHLLVLLTLHAGAQQDFPKTPAGEKLKQLLAAFELETAQAFIENDFSDKFLNAFPMKDHLDFFRQVRMMHGGFTLHSIESGTAVKLTAIVKSKKRETWRRIDLAVEPDPPHKIAGLGIDIAETPADYEYTGPKHDLVSKLRPDPKAVRRGEVAARIDEHLSKQEEQGFSGAILVAKGGDIILAKGYGYAHRENKVPFHTESAFDIGSITKQFTGAAILKLETMGKLRTDDPITKYFKNVPEGKKNITIHHLLTHAAGFSDALGFDYAPVPREEFITLALGSSLKSQTGERYHYSNVGYSLLAAIIEIVTGDGYERFLHDHLFKPAGMSDTGYRLPDWRENQVAHGYRGEKYFGQPHTQDWDDDGPWWHLRGNGGIISTIHDMYRWHLALAGDKVLSEEAKTKYYTPHILEGPGADTHYGYGWVVAESSRGTTVYMHNGGNPYFANDCYRYVDDDVFVYIASNNGERSAIEQSGTILKMIFD